MERYEKNGGLRGERLSELIKQNGKLGPEKVFAWLEPVVRQLAGEHLRGRVRGDICPENILIHNRLWFPFPLSEEMGKNRFSGTDDENLFHGCRRAWGQIKPSQAERRHVWEPLETGLNREEAGPWSDVYSLCAGIYYAVTGCLPEEAGKRITGSELQRPSQTGTEIGERREAALMKGLALLPKDRWQDGDALYQALYPAEMELQQSENHSGEKPAGGSGRNNTENHAEKNIEKNTGKNTENVGPDRRKRTGLLAGAGILAAAAVLFLMTRSAGSSPAEGNARFARSSTESAASQEALQILQEEEKAEIQETEAQGTGAQEERQETEAQEAESRETESREDRRNMLMTDNSSDKQVLLGTDIPCEAVRTVTFLDSLADRPETFWDVSADGDGSVAAWAEENGEGYDLYIGAEGGVTASPDSSLLFINCNNLTRVSFGDHFDTSQVTDMHSMFYKCASLAEADVGSFDTSRVTDMAVMFYECGNLTELDVSGFDTSQVTRMTAMFYGCGSLETLDISGFDMSNVTNADDMLTGTRWES